jgi:hypothetical protein
MSSRPAMSFRKRFSGFVDKTGLNWTAISRNGCLPFAATVPSTSDATYGAFTEYGYWAGNEWGGHENLPKGHWVYVAPHWYIWGETSAKKPAASAKE